MTRAGVLLLAVLSVSSAAPPRIAFLKPIPRIVGTRDEFGLKVRVEPDPANRLLIVAALDASGETVRRTDEQLEGDASPRTRWIRWRVLPAGDLLVIAEVWDHQRPLGKASIPLCVRGPVDDICPSLVAEP